MDDIFENAEALTEQEIREILGESDEMPPSYEDLSEEEIDDILNSDEGIA